MTQDTVKSLSDTELTQMISWAESEIKARAEQRKREAIAKIRVLAAQAGVSVAIGGIRGRPARIKPESPKVKAH